MTTLVEHIRTMYKVDNASEAERRFNAAVEDVFSNRYYIHNIVFEDIYHADYNPGHYVVQARLYIEAKDGQSNPSYTGELELIKTYDPVAAGQLSEWAIIDWLENYWVIIGIILAIIGLIIAVVI